MKLERRNFLALITHSIAGFALTPLLDPITGIKAQDPNKPIESRSCWLDVCAPLVIHDPEMDLSSEVVLTSDNFIGAKGYSDGADATEYEIHLYNSDGTAIGEGGVARRLVVPAMQTTVLPVGDLVGSDNRFWGGLKVRLRPSTRTPTHASDLFSSAFVRWKTKESFTNVHANPDPLQWQRPDSFFYSMPFPPLEEYQCVYSVFNPYPNQSVGTVAIYDQFGIKLKDVPYDLKPFSSLLLDLRSGETGIEIKDLLRKPNKNRDRNSPLFKGASKGGTIAVTNNQGTVKNFGYLFIKQEASARFSVEHPIHQPPYNPVASKSPFDATGKFKAQNILYTPLVFRSKKLGGITLESRFHLSSGAPVEVILWMAPLITDEKGNVVWQAGETAKFPATISEKQIERGIIKLGGQQSCILDCSQLNLTRNFSGGLSLAIRPLSNHTLMKVEVRAVEWDATAFTHFRPGLAAARAYQKPLHRAGLATDYIASGARLETNSGKISRDEVIAVINIDDRNIPGSPTLEVFAPGGLVARIPLGEVSGFGCRHYLLSELVSGKIGSNDLSLRLIDEQATLLMSVLHLDYSRRDIAADHGSDRFSTFSEFTCDRKA